MAEKIGGYVFGQQPEEEPERKGQTPEEQLFSWRFDQLIRAGFDPKTAGDIAERRDIDLHHACDMARAKGAVWATDFYFSS